MLSELKRVSKDLSYLLLYMNSVPKDYKRDRIDAGAFEGEYISDILYERVEELNETIREIERAVQIIGTGKRLSDEV